MKFSVTITGLKPDGVSEVQARANLVKLLKATPEKIDQLLASVPVVVKKNVDRELGEKYIRVLSQAGVLAQIEPEVLELSLEPTVEKAPEETPRFTCPQCGVVVQKVGKCPACLESSTPATKQNDSADKTARRRERTEKIRESAFALVIDWARGNVWKAAIVFILIPIFGGNLLISTIFYTQDKHLVYQTISKRTLCVKDPLDFARVQGHANQELASIFRRDFKGEEREQVLDKWDNLACRANYEMELGNIGDEPVSTTIEFATWRFFTGSRKKDLIFYPKFQDLSSVSNRMHNPEASQEEGKYRLANIQPGTLINLRFGGWVEGKDGAVGWEEMLANITVDEGVVEVGDPQATTFGRLLTVFF